VFVVLWQVIEELAHETLHDMTLKALFFRSMALATGLFRWIDCFRGDIAAAEREMAGRWTGTVGQPLLWPEAGLC
jgi:hypothetical protein